MPEIKVKTPGIDKLELKAKVMEEKENGQVVDRHVVTSVKFEYEGTPLLMNQVLMAIASEHEVNVTFSSPQSIMSIEQDVEDMVEVSVR
jgi:hypothetical protein